MGIVIKSLAEAPELRSQYLKLIEQHFPKGEPCARKMSQQDEFFILLAEENSKNQLMAVDDTQNSVVSVLSYKRFQMTFPFSQPLPLECIGIGLVVTSPQARLQGLSKKLQQEAEERARTEGVALSILWSDLVEFYEKLNYVPCGQETQWELNKNHNLKLKQYLLAKKIKFKTQPVNHYSEIEGLYKKLNIGPVRNPTLYQKALSMSDLWANLVMDEKNQPRAYLIRGKGRDLRSTIHEMAGDEDYCLAGLAELIDKYPISSKPLTLQVPTQIPLALSKHLGEGKMMTMGLIKVLRPLTLVNWIVQSNLIPKDSVLMFDKKKYQFVRQNEVLFSTEHSADILQLFLGPLHPTEFTNFPSAAKAVLNDYQTPPLYFWGLDSV